MKAILGEREKKAQIQADIYCLTAINVHPYIQSYKENKAIYLDTVAGEALSML